MGNVVLNNGSTSVVFRAADFQIPVKTPKQLVQRMIPNTAVIPAVQDVSDVPEQFLECEVLLFRADQSTTVQGADSLYAFFEQQDPLGVNGMGQSFMLTDADGDVFQVRFVDKLGGGLREVKKDTHFRGSFRLMVEPTLPVDMSTSLVGWWVAYDPGNNGGDLSSWTDLDAVGDTGKEWSDKSGNGYDGVQATAANRPQWFDRANAAAINSRPVVCFDGVNDILEANGITTNFDGQTDLPWTAFFVLDLDIAGSQASDTMLGMGNSGGATSDKIRWQNDALNQWEIHGDDGAITRTDSTATMTISADTIIAYTFDGTAIKLYDLGTEQTIPDTFAGLGQVDVNRGRIGGAHETAADAKWIDADMGEIMLWSRELSRGELRRQFVRLRDMWQLQLTG